MFSQIMLAAIIFSVTQACIHRDINVQHIDDNIQRRSTYTPSTLKTGITNVKIFTGTHFRRGALAIVGDQITFDLKHVTTWIDGNGGFLIPGLIDSHCHPASIKDLQRLSSYGVTTALNMACANYALCASLKDQPGLTSFFTADHGITAPNTTHAIVFQTPPELLITDPSQAPEFVGYAFGNNSDWLKITAERNGPSQETQTRLVKLTHELGRQTMTHATLIPAYLQAIASGTDGIQHTPGDGLLTPNMIDNILTNNKWVTPTTILVQALLRYPQALAVSTYTNLSWPIVVKNVQSMRAAGIPLLVGTDAIPSAGPLASRVQHPLGNSLHDELDIFVNQVGFKPSEALRAATLLPAKMHRLFDRGIIAEGKRADLVLLNSNPLKNISASRDIARVWNGGVEFISAAEF
jgi:imidazolonepropionase-like amidohydrolase